MSRNLPGEPRMDSSSGDAALDAALAAAFGPESKPPLPAGNSVLQALSAMLSSVPHVQLRDAESGIRAPIVRPRSEEMPDVQDAHSRYQLHGEIARGGMGAVLKGRDTDLGRDIALKVLLETHQGKTELVQRFVEEAQIAGQLQHPGVVPVYELGQFADQRPYFTMKLVKGQTLAKLLEERKEPQENQAQLLKVFEQICQTLAYAHARGVIHRDLKPSNIMVGAFGEVQVMDWGLAKVLAEGGVADEAKTQLRQEVSVIRTRRSEGSETPVGLGSQTQAGSVLGTPAYMAPEQARGEVELIDERADVFGLGALLCEILTGQPPFTGRGAEAQRKAQKAKLDEAHARLDGCGADAELVGLAMHCLAAEPWDRPRNAGAVATAIAAYQQSVAQRLRQAELERAAAEARAVEEGHTRQMAEAKAVAERKRRRATLALAAALLTIVGAGGGAAAWWWQEQTTRVRDVDAALAEAESHQQSGRWPEVRAALERAEGRLGGGGPDDLRARVAQARRDVNMVEELDEIRLKPSEVREGGFDYAGSVPRYVEAFARYGIREAERNTAEAAKRVRESAIRDDLLAALDAWLRSKNATPGDWLYQLLAAADDNAWRQEFRAAAARRDMAKLKHLARQAEASTQPTTLLHSLGMELQNAGLAEEAVAFLRRAQERQRGDFWINFDLTGLLLWQVKPPRPQLAIPFARAALAIRPVASVHDRLGIALADNGDLEGAIAEYRQAIRLDPKLSWSHNNLGIALKRKGDVDGAMAEYHRAIKLNPQSVTAHNNLGIALRDKGDLQGALAELHVAISLDPKNAEVHGNLGFVLRDKGDLQGALAEYRLAVSLRPKSAKAHNNLGAALRDKGDFQGAVAEHRLAISLDPEDARGHYGLGNALYLAGDLDGAIAACRKSIELDPQVAGPHSDLGAALHDIGDLDGAIAACRRAITLDPKLAVGHNNLGGALMDKGELKGAIAAFREALTLDPKFAPAVSNLEVALRLQASEGKLPAVLTGKVKPDPSGRADLATPCSHSSKQLYTTAAGWFLEAFQAKPDLAEDKEKQYRFNAACAAARAGSGHGKDQPLPDDQARAGWRQQARIWLRADLSVYATRLQAGKPEDRNWVQQRLRHWQRDQDLAGVRDREAIARLPAEERPAWRQLWADVNALLQKAQANP